MKVRIYDKEVTLKDAIDGYPFTSINWERKSIFRPRFEIVNFDPVESSYHMIVFLKKYVIIR